MYTKFRTNCLIHTVTAVYTWGIINVITIAYSNIILLLLPSALYFGLRNT